MASLNAYQIRFWRFRENLTPHPFIDLDMKYIDADLLRKVMKEHTLFYAGQANLLDDTNALDGYDEVLAIIDSLQQEQQEVDLEKELDTWRHEHFRGKRDGHFSGEYLERSSQLALVTHFYELGKKQ